MNSGDRLEGRYRLGEVLGQGGMGVVYRAFDERLERAVAVKVLAATQSDAPEAHARFLREARRTAQLRHPNLVEVFDVGETQTGEPFFVMEHLLGELLSAFSTAHGALDARTFTSIAKQVCDGVATAHAAGVVHRDLKPGNVMIVDDMRVKILDFGIYKENTATAALTAEGSFVGTVGYAAPEQIRGEPLDARADVYSLGVIFYELLAGAALFEAGSLATQLHHHLSVEPRALGDRIAGVPKPISAAIMRALSKEPERRFASAAEFGEALGAAPAPSHVELEEVPEQDDNVEIELDIAPRPTSMAPSPVRVTAAPMVVAPFAPSPSYAMQVTPPPAFLAPLGVMPVSIAKRVSVYSMFAAVVVTVFFHAGLITVVGLVVVGILAGINWWVRWRLDLLEPEN